MKRKYKVLILLGYLNKFIIKLLSKNPRLYEKYVLIPNKINQDNKRFLPTQKMIDELLDKAKLNETQKEEYVKRLREKEEEADSLRRQLRRIDMKYRNIIEHRNELSLPARFLQTIFDAFSPKELKLIRSVHFTDLPNSLKDKMIDLDIVMPDGELTPKGKILFENLDNIM